MIHKQTYANKVIVSAFMEPTVAAFSRDYPEIRMAFLWDKSLWWPMAFQFGPKSFMKKNAVRIFHPDAALVTPGMVRQIKLEGWEIIPTSALGGRQSRAALVLSDDCRCRWSMYELSSRDAAVAAGGHG